MLAERHISICEPITKTVDLHANAWKMAVRDNDNCFSKGIGIQPEQ